MKKLRDITAEAAILTAIQGAIKDALEELKTGDLRAAMIDNHGETAGQTVNIDIPGLGKVGRATLNLTNDKVQVVNETTLAEWMQVNVPNSTEYVLTIKPAVKTALIDRLTLVGADFESGAVVDPDLADPETGLSPRVPGLMAVKGGQFSATPSITVSSADKTRIVDVFRSKPVRELMAAPDATAEPQADPFVVPADPFMAPAATDPGVVEGEVVQATTIPTLDELKVQLPNRDAVRAEAERLGVELPAGWMPQAGRKLIVAHYDRKLTAEAHAADVGARLIAQGAAANATAASL